MFEKLRFSDESNPIRTQYYVNSFRWTVSWHNICITKSYNLKKNSKMLRKGNQKPKVYHSIRSYVYCCWHYLWFFWVGEWENMQSGAIISDQKQIGIIWCRIERDISTFSDKFLQNFRTLTVYNFQTAWRTHCWHSSDCAGDYKNEQKMASRQRAISKSQNYKYNLLWAQFLFGLTLKTIWLKVDFAKYLCCLVCKQCM